MWSDLIYAKTCQKRIVFLFIYEKVCKTFSKARSKANLNYCCLPPVYAKFCAIATEQGGAFVCK